MSTFNKIYKKVANNSDSNDYQVVGQVGVNGIPLDIMKGASSSSDGVIGLVPKPSKGSANRYLRSDGTWSVPPDNNTTYPLVSINNNGLMLKEDKKILDSMDLFIESMKLGNIFHVASMLLQEKSTNRYNPGYGGNEEFSDCFRFPYTKLLDVLFDGTDNYALYLEYSINGMQTINVHWIAPSGGNVFTKIKDSNKTYMKCTVKYQTYIKNPTTSASNGSFRPLLDIYLGYKKDDSTVWYNNQNNRCSRFSYDLGYTLDTANIE